MESVLAVKAFWLATKGAMLKYTSMRQALENSN